MKSRIRSIIAPTLALGIAILTLGSATPASADEHEKQAPREGREAVELFEVATSPSGRTRPKQARKLNAKEIRQARALYQANQRMLRHQRNLWLGHEPLRPTFRTVPTMNSRYGRRTIYVPVYVR